VAESRSWRCTTGTRSDLAPVTQDFGSAPAPPRELGSGGTGALTSGGGLREISPFVPGLVAVASAWWVRTPPGDPFCVSALARVDSFMETYSGALPLGSGTEEWPWWGGGGNGGMNALTAGDAGAVQNQMFANLMTLVQYDEVWSPSLSGRSWEVARCRIPFWS